MRDPSDTGLGPIGRIDHANIPGNVTIEMHPHINDDILSYFRKGHAQHIDSEGISATVSKKKLMLMKAGKIFHHEEHMPEPLEGLQIFIRPRIKDDVPEVLFRDLKGETDSVDQWRLIASPNEDSTLQFSSQTWIYDTSISSGKVMDMPQYDKEKLTGLLYVFNGQVLVNEEIQLDKGESIVFHQEDIQVKALEGSELVLFLVDKESEYYDGGMYSGNKA